MKFSDDEKMESIKDGLIEVLKEIRNDTTPKGAADIVILSIVGILKSRDVRVEANNGAAYEVNISTYLDRNKDILGKVHGSSKLKMGQDLLKNMEENYEWFGSPESLTYGEFKENLLNIAHQLDGEDPISLTNKQKEQMKNVFKKMSEYEGKVNMVHNTKEVDIHNILEDMFEKGGTKQVILTGAPGTGKTHSVREFAEASGSLMKFVQFHPSYDYTDFVEGLRPVKMKDNVGNEVTSFVRLDGIFKEFCREIVDNEETDRCFFIIDEINRADLSKVFGELMFGLEESYRGKLIQTQYENLNTYKIGENGFGELIEADCFKDGFYIPENLYIVGTMNDIDRSVESFDFALRRRFKWIDIKANEVMKGTLLSMLESEVSEEAILELAERAIKMNNIITNKDELGLNEAFNIGPSYFNSYDGENELEIWEHNIEPILREYCRGRKNEDINTFIEECKKEFFKDKDIVNQEQE